MSAMKYNKIISYIFHPIIFPIIGTIIYFILLPRHIEASVKNSIIFSTFITTYALPLLFIYLLKKLKLVNSYNMETIEERKFPLLFFTLLSYMLGILLLRTNMVSELSLLYFGMTFTLLTAYLLLYRNFKISIHMLGIGGLISFIGVVGYTYELNLILILAAAFVLAGLIANSRLQLRAHTEKEVYLGFALGFVTQIVVSIIYNL